MALSPALLDARGFLPFGALVPAPKAGYIVFGQSAPPPFDVAALRVYASRFLGAKLGLSAEKRGEAPPHDLAFVLVYTGDEGGTVAVEARAATDVDRALAVRAEVRPAGLADLAARCPRVFVVHADSTNERAALVVACAIAGTSLGPIVTLDGGAIFGVKTGRERLEKLAPPR